MKMTRITTIAAVTIALSFFQYNTVLAQDTKKDKSKKEAKKDDSDEDDSDLQPETGEQETKVQKSNTHGKSHLGVEGGLNLAQFTGKGSSGTSIAGLRAGTLIDIPVSDRLYVQPGVYYAMTGSGLPGYDIRLNTIQVPVNLIYKFGKTGRNHIFMGIGLCYGYNISGKVNPGGLKLNIGSDAVTDNVKASDVNLGLNIGYELAHGLFFRIGYMAGLKNLDPTTASAGSVHSSAFNLQVGYFFGKKK